MEPPVRPDPRPVGGLGQVTVEGVAVVFHAGRFSFFEQVAGGHAVTVEHAEGNEGVLRGVGLGVKMGLGLSEKRGRQHQQSLFVGFDQLLGCILGIVSSCVHFDDMIVDVGIPGLVGPTRNVRFNNLVGIIGGIQEIPCLLKKKVPNLAFNVVLFNLVAVVIV